MVVEFKDTEDNTGANVTILVVQLEKDVCVWCSVTQLKQGLILHLNL